ncbi:hypothetical protein SEA_COMRADE_46 [Streptomyces phage Comrade]|uniref:Uncharacterized protein n=3 Tax=Gilsonvirus comrade TaxID=2846395 RepID=A0A345MDY0_9CAUD|nr:hypothetical protein HWB84_gp200 [Streptomyces phage Comrade]AXH68761.1 hypothetical protein SEA_SPARKLEGODDESS_46 [Streptomyces phage SparkleGoddess]AXQ63319.1 hypothetical protein SEA_COMRADE_46 [Streptomyces phage Comrade]QQO39732.1 hypothetical protein SEA_BELFORT_47 [Streptomyces phage Belfort]QZE11642.1 hypothetical protein SEA_KARP_45 [Streptomyces phage Karp]
MWPFRRKRELPEIPTDKTDYPYGLFIVTEAGYFLIRNGERLGVKTTRMACSWHSHISLSSEAAVAHLPVTGHVGFRDGTLIRNQADKRDYLISRGLKRHIVSPDVYERYGLAEGNIIVVSDEEANFHSDGEVLS